MKKVIFYISVSIATLLLINIASLLINHLDQLTRYGYGFLTGKIILFSIFVGLAFYLGRQRKTL